MEKDGGGQQGLLEQVDVERAVKEQVVEGVVVVQVGWGADMEAG